MKSISTLSLAACLAIFLVTGCGLPTHTAVYDIGLTEVERPSEAQERYGEQRITRVEEEGIDKYYFEDEMVQIIWQPTSSQVPFVLHNKTDHSIKIIWDEAVFADRYGACHRVMHSGVKYADRDSSQPPSVVIRNGHISDFLVPADHAYYDNGRYTGGWKTEPILPIMGGNELRQIAEERVGTSLQVLLPLEIQGVVNEYIFTFEVSGANVLHVNKAHVPKKPQKS